MSLQAASPSSTGVDNNIGLTDIAITNISSAQNNCGDASGNDGNDNGNGNGGSTSGRSTDINSRSNPDIASSFNGAGIAKTKTLDLEPNPFEQSFAQPSDPNGKAQPQSNEAVFNKNINLISKEKPLAKPQSDTQLSNLRNFDQQTILDNLVHSGNSANTENAAKPHNKVDINSAFSQSVPSLNTQQQQVQQHQKQHQRQSPEQSSQQIVQSQGQVQNSIPAQQSNSKHIQPNNTLNLAQRLENATMAPPVLTPGGTKRMTPNVLPPLPGIVSPGGGSFLGTPGIWNALFPQTPGIAMQGMLMQNAAVPNSNLNANSVVNLNGHVQPNVPTSVPLNMSAMGAFSPTTLATAQHQLQQQQQQQHQQQQQNKNYNNLQKQIQQIQQVQQAQHAEQVHQVRRQAEQHAEQQLKQAQIQLQQAQIQAQVQAQVLAQVQQMNNSNPSSSTTIPTSNTGVGSTGNTATSHTTGQASGHVSQSHTPVETMLMKTESGHHIQISPHQAQQAQAQAQAQLQQAQMQQASAQAQLQQVQVQAQLQQQAQAQAQLQAQPAQPGQQGPTQQSQQAQLQQQQSSHQQQQHQQQQHQQQQQQQQQLFNFLLNAKRSGLTPNESSLRTGLTPGGMGSTNMNLYPANNSMYSYFSMTPGGITPITGMLNSIGESSIPVGANASNMSVGNSGTGTNTTDNKKGISPQNTLNNLNGVPMETLNPMMMQQVPMSGTASVPVTGLAPLTNEQIQQSSLTVSQVGLNKDSVGSSVVGSSNNTPGLMMKPVGRAADIITKKGFNTDVILGNTDHHEGVVGAVDDTSDLQKKRTATESSPNDSKRVKKPTKAKKISVKKRGGKKGEVPVESSPVSNSKNEADEELDQNSVEHDQEKNDVEGAELAAKPRRRRALTEAERRANFLERNRVAASRCRQRKKEMVETMKVELASTQAENEALQEQVETLREHALTLRTLLYAHRDCPSLLGQVGGPDSLSAVLAATNYAAELTAEGEGAREQGDELPNVAAVVAHTTSMAIERERRTSK